MIRVAVFIAMVFLVAAGFAWLADRPGAVVFTWQDYEVRASLMVAATALLILIAALAFLGSLLRGLFNMPGMLGRLIGARRRERGYRALSTGMIAVGAGELRRLRGEEKGHRFAAEEGERLVRGTARGAHIAGADRDHARRQGAIAALAAAGADQAAEHAGHIEQTAEQAAEEGERRD